MPKWIAANTPDTEKLSEDMRQAISDLEDTSVTGDDLGLKYGFDWNEMEHATNDLIARKFLPHVPEDLDTTILKALYVAGLLAGISYQKRKRDE